MGRLMGEYPLILNVERRGTRIVGNGTLASLGQWFSLVLLLIILNMRSSLCCMLNHGIIQIWSGTYRSGSASLEGLLMLAEALKI